MKIRNDVKKIMYTTDDSADIKYVNCVCLGRYCGVAGQLSRLGLRSQSRPFDWCLSYYEAVLNQIENVFQDFMMYENLELYKGDKSNRTFIDKKYRFSFPHDIQNNFESDYESIKQKYDRRIVSFRKSITKPTVFFRCVRDQEEIYYINDNWEMAKGLLKGVNKDNIIIYIYRRGLNGLTNKVQSFALDIDQYIGRIYEMSHMFDKSDELLYFCSHILNREIIQRNVIYDKNTNAQKVIAATVNKCIEEGIDGGEQVILKSLDAIYSSGIYIWGEIWDSSG